MKHRITLPTRAQYLISWALDYYADCPPAPAGGAAREMRYRAKELHRWLENTRSFDTAVYVIPQWDIQIIISALAKYSTHLYCSFTRHAQSTATDAEWAAIQMSKRYLAVREQYLAEVERQAVRELAKDADVVLDYMIEMSEMHYAISRRGLI